MRLIGGLRFSTSLPLFTDHSFMGIMFPSCCLSHWASSQHYHTTYEITAFKSFLSPYDLKIQLFIMKATKNASETHHHIYAMSVSHQGTLNMVEDQIHGITCMQSSRPVEAGQQLTERLLHPVSVSHRPARISGDTFTNTEFSSFQKICPLHWPSRCLTVVLSPSKQDYSNLPFISLSEKWFQATVQMPIREYGKMFSQITCHWHSVWARRMMCHMCTAGKATFPKRSE